MAVFRVEKIKNYTVMSNHHLRDKSLSLKAKGLLSLMLSLPEDWDYTTKGLARICRDGVDSIRSAVQELEQRGYVVRNRVRNEKGQLGEMEYTIFEQPQAAPDPPAPDPDRPEPEKQDLENFDLEHSCPEEPEPETPVQVDSQPEQVSPVRDRPEWENPVQVFPAQLNTKKLSKEELSTERIQSLQFFPGETNPKKMKRRMTAQQIEEYREYIRENIGYKALLEESPGDRERVDELVELLTETICSQKEQIRIGGNELPRESVKSRLLKLDREHIRFVLDCLERNTTRIRNIRQYLLTTLYNAPATIDNYYTALVNHDLHSRSA